MTSLRGRLIVATPSLADPNFAHTVIFLLDHGDDGALGVVLNRPSTIDVTEALTGWEAMTAPPRVVYVGGPVQPEAVVALGTSSVETEALQPVVDGIAIVDLRSDPVLVVGDVDNVRLFAGYAGWGAGQLESEVEAGGWFVLDATAADVFTADPDRLWLHVLSRQGGLFSTISEDPSLN